MTENEKIRIWQLEKMVTAEKEKTKAYGHLIDVYTTYIAILLNKMGATKDAPVAITEEEIKEAMEHYNVMGTYSDGEVKVKLYGFDTRSENGGVSAEITEPPGKKEDKPESSI